MNAVKQQAGLSMIELLIALAISSFLILGITQVYIDNKRNYLFQQTQAANLEGGRFAALILNDYLGRTGYRRAPSQLLETAFPQRSAEGDCQQFDTGSAITGLDPSVGTGFCIRYQPLSSGELDCQGVASTAFTDDTAFIEPPTESLIVLAFKYEPGAGANIQDGNLRCKSLNAANPQYVELVRGIADLRLDFGVGKSDLLEKEITQFVAQKDWTPATGAIRSVRYGLLLAGRKSQRDSDDSKVLSDWLAKAPGAEKTRLETNDDKRIYQVAGSTQTLRNLMP